MCLVTAQDGAVPLIKRHTVQCTDWACSYPCTLEVFCSIYSFAVSIWNQVSGLEVNSVLILSSCFLFVCFCICVFMMSFSLQILLLVDISLSNTGI